MLTNREIRVLQLKKNGLRQIEIASELKISQPAVSKFYNNAQKKVKHAHEIIEIVTSIENGDQKKR